MKTIGQILNDGGRNQINFGEEDSIGKSDLSLGRSLLIQCSRSVNRIHNRDDAVNHVELSDFFIHEESLSNGAGVCKTGRFDDDAVKVGFSFLFTLHQTDEVFSQVASNGAADAAVVHRNDFFIFALNEKIIVDAFFTEFVFDDGYLLTVFFSENTVKKRCFTCAQKTGNNCDRN